MTAAPSPLQNELVGAILSRKYPLTRVVGSGGMGTVFESTSPNDGQPIAVKVLGASYLDDVDIKRRFLEEGLTCQRLSHPNIVRVFDVAEAEDGTPYIVMELLEGVPLGAYTRSGARVPVTQAVTILHGILAGLGAAHAQGIVHRDLKPENVMLAREQNGEFITKILDFGIAKVMDVAGGMGSRTRTGVLLGTPAYMSPEQIKNAKDVDARADLWSAGVMFYEMLTGRVAFPAPTEYARLSAVLHAEPPPIEAIVPELSRLATFMRLALQKDRAQRYQSALEMARALTTAMGNAAASLPMSRLPDVPSLWSPTLAPTGATGASGVAPAVLAIPSGPSGPRLVAMNVPTTGPSGTLASAAGRSVSDPTPLVEMALRGTAPSEIHPKHAAFGAERRGVAAWLVVVFVTSALVVGFVVGLTVARLH